MSAVKWNSFFPYVAPEVFECPEITMEIAVRDSAIEFCRRTFVWQESLDQITTVKGVSTYDLEPAAGTIVEQILDAICDGSRLTSAKTVDLPTNRDSFQGKPKSYSLMFGDQVRLYPIPDNKGTLNLTVALTPSSSSSGIDSTLFERYKEVIASGAKHRLLNLPNKSWSNPPLAQYHLTQYMRGIGEARIRLDGGQSHVISTRRFV